MKSLHATALPLEAVSSDTTVGIDASGDASVHLTVGIDTHIWSLNYAGLREVCLRRGGIQDKTLLTKASYGAYWDLQYTLPLGFLGSADASQRMGDELLKRVRAVEEGKWTGVSDEDMRGRLHVDECVAVITAHHSRV